MFLKAIFIRGVTMNEEIYNYIKANKEILELFEEEELKEIFTILNSELSNAKKKEAIDTIIKRTNE